MTHLVYNGLYYLYATKERLEVTRTLNHPQFMYTTITAAKEEERLHDLSQKVQGLYIDQSLLLPN